MHILLKKTLSSDTNVDDFVTLTVTFFKKKAILEVFLPLGAFIIISVLQTHLFWTSFSMDLIILAHINISANSMENYVVKCLICIYFEQFTYGHIFNVFSKTT